MDLKTAVKSFFSDYDFSPIKSELSLIFLRHDGIPIAAKNINREKFEENEAVGALSAGLWQAAKSLMDVAKKNDQIEDNSYRLSFDTSDAGIYLLELAPSKNERYYMAALFLGEVNPGYLKNFLRTFVREFNSFLAPTRVENDEQENNDEYLFQNITDEEMNKLFSFAGS